MEILKQPQFAVMPLEEEVCILFAANKGYLDEIPLESVKDFEQKLIKNLRDEHKDIMGEIQSTKDISDKTQEKLKKAIESFVLSYKT